MIPGSFDYHAPSSLDEAIELLGKLGEDAKILAGGHSLIPMMKLRLAQMDIYHLLGMKCHHLGTTVFQEPAVLHQWWQLFGMI